MGTYPLPARLPAAAEEPGGGRKSTEEPGRTRKNLEEPGRVLKNQEELKGSSHCDYGWSVEDERVKKQK